MLTGLFSIGIQPLGNCCTLSIQVLVINFSLVIIIKTDHSSAAVANHGVLLYMMSNQDRKSVTLKVVELVSPAIVTEFSV